MWRSPQQRWSKPFSTYLRLVLQQHTLPQPPADCCPSLPPSFPPSLRPCFLFIDSSSRFHLSALLDASDPIPPSIFLFCPLSPLLPFFSCSALCPLNICLLHTLSLLLPLQISCLLALFLCDLSPCLFPSPFSLSSLFGNPFPLNYGQRCSLETLSPHLESS